MKPLEPSLRDIATFLAVVDSGGVGPASEKLGYTQPAVSLQIQRLETALGAELFDRTGRRLLLNARGSRTVDAARALLAQAQRLKSVVDAEGVYETQTLTIGVLEPTASLRVVPIVKKIQKRMPQASIKIVGLGAASIAKAAEEGNIDAALTSQSSVRGWVYEPLFTERLAAAVPASHPLASKKVVSLSRLSSEPLVLTDGSCVYRKTIERAFSRVGRSTQVAIEAGSVAWLPTGVASGVGLTIVPRDMIMPSGVSIIPIRESIGFSIGLLRPGRLIKDSLVSIFAEELRQLRR